MCTNKIQTRMKLNQLYVRLCHLKSVCNVFSIGARKKKKKTPRVGIGSEVFVVVIIFYVTDGG